jgi:hypothetical protein
MDLLSLPQEGVDVLEFGIGRGDAKVVEDRIELPLHPGESAVHTAELAFHGRRAQHGSPYEDDDA